MRKAIATAALIGLLTTAGGCAWLSKHGPETLTELAKLVCLYAAKDRPAADRAKKDDECWCAEHAGDFAEDTTNAVLAGSRKAGLAVPAETSGGGD